MASSHCLRNLSGSGVHPHILPPLDDHEVFIQLRCFGIYLITDQKPLPQLEATNGNYHGNLDGRLPEGSLAVAARHRGEQSRPVPYCPTTEIIVQKAGADWRRIRGYHPYRQLHDRAIRRWDESQRPRALPVRDRPRDASIVAGMTRVRKAERAHAPAFLIPYHNLL